MNTADFNSKLTEEIKSQVIGTVRVLRDKHLTVGFAESCTGGLLSSFFTEQAGVSDVFTGSIISYDNKIKQRYLNVSAEMLKQHGAVSMVTARQMAEQAQSQLEVSVAISITGIAGPGGGTEQKPVGTVFIAVAGMGFATQVFECHFIGDRKAVQLQSCQTAVRHLQDFIEKRTE
jgi:nicotinamide-nucleotide amidase